MSKVAGLALNGRRLFFGNSEYASERGNILSGVRQSFKPENSKEPPQVTVETVTQASTKVVGVCMYKKNDRIVWIIQIVIEYMIDYC